MTTTTPECAICDILQTNKHIILLTDYWRVALADEQACLGRSYVTLRNHKESLSELSDAEWQDYIQLVQLIERGYVKAFGSGQPFNWACLMNDAYKELRPTPHVHWHLRPRHVRPITINGEEFTDPEYGHHYRRSRKQFPSEDTLQAIVTLLKAHM